jgi:hypothetical protein
MFRFTIRDVLWLTALVAMGVAWGVHARRENQRFRVIADKMREYTHLNLEHKVKIVELQKQLDEAVQSKP